MLRPTLRRDGHRVQFNDLVVAAASRPAVPATDRQHSGGSRADSWLGSTLLTRVRQQLCSGPECHNASPILGRGGHHVQFNDLVVAAAITHVGQQLCLVPERHCASPNLATQQPHVPAWRLGGRIRQHACRPCHGLATQSRVAVRLQDRLDISSLTRSAG